MKPAEHIHRLSWETYQGLGNKVRPGVKLTDIISPLLNDVQQTTVKQHTIMEVAPQNRTAELPDSPLIPIDDVE